MKNIFTIFLFFLSLISISSLIAQDKSLIQNELIVRSESTFPELPENFNYKVTPISRSLNLYLVTFDNIQSCKKAEQILAEKESIISTSTNIKITFRDSVPNDPAFPNQTYWNSLEEYGVNAAQAWQYTQGGQNRNGENIVIAIVDDGLDISHPDLAANIYINENEIPGNNIDDDGNGFIDDVNGWNFRDNTGEINALIESDHGTQVAGIIGASGNDSFGIAGANWNANLMPVTLGNDATLDQVIQAYEYVLNQRRLYNASNGTEGAFIVAMNNSFGAEGFQYASAPFWCDFIDTLGEAGILTVSAVTNNIINIDEVGDLPTVCPSPYLITVASVGQNGRWYQGGISEFYVDILAPGEALETTLPDSSYGRFNGTSASSALISGLVGLIHSVACEQDITRIKEDPSLVKGVIEDFSFQLQYLNSKTRSGGIVNYGNVISVLNSQCSECTFLGLNFSQNNDENIFSLGDTSSSVIWYSRNIGIFDWDTISTADTLRVSRNGGCELRYIGVQQICPDGSSTDIIFPIDDFIEQNCEACDEMTCLPANDLTTNYWIETVQVNDGEPFYTGNDLGYAKYNGKSSFFITTSEDNTLNFDLRGDNDNQRFSLAIWIDMNQDGQLLPNELVGSNMNVFTNTNASVDLNIPFNAQTGLRTMRIGLVPTSQVQDLTPCPVEFNQVYYEDHCIMLDISDPICDSANVVFIDSTPSSIILGLSPMFAEDEALNARFRKQGENEWEDIRSFLGNEDGITTLGDLEGPCEAYEIQVRRVCPSDTSAWSQIYTHKTLCPSSTNNAVVQKMQVYPNPTSDLIYIYAEEYTQIDEVRILDLRGKIYNQIQNNGFDQGIQIQYLPSGIYILQAIVDDQVQNMKFIKQ